MKHTNVFLTAFVIVIILSAGVYAASNDSLNISMPINIVDTTLKIWISNTTYIRGDILHLIAFLTNDNYSLADKNIEFYQDSSQIETQTTDENGTASIDIDTTNISGSHILSADFTGSEGYGVSTDFTEIEEAQINDTSEESDETVMTNDNISEDETSNESISENDSIVFDNETVSDANFTENLETPNNTLESENQNGSEENNTEELTNTTEIIDDTLQEEPIVNPIIENQTVPESDNTQINDALPAIEDISDGTNYTVEKFNDCVNEAYTKNIPEYGNCTHNISICDDEPKNESCHEEITNYECYIGLKSIEKMRSKCTITGYHISRYNLDTKDYVCNIDTTDKDSTVVMCDSKYDGNGDGKCTSGESCMKYIITKSNIESFEKNSNDNYQPSDDSYFLNEISVKEVEE